MKTRNKNELTFSQLCVEVKSENTFPQFSPFGGCKFYRIHTFCVEKNGFNERREEEQRVEREG